MGNIVSIPFEKSNFVPQYEYTDAMYKEDCRIARWCVYKKYATVFTEKLASVFNCTVEQMQAIILRKEQTK